MTKSPEKENHFAPTLLLSHTWTPSMHQGPARSPANAEGASHEAASIYRQLLPVVHQGLPQIRDFMLNP